MAVLSAVIYGLMPLMAVNIYAGGVNAVTLVALRNILALPVLAIIAVIKDKSLKIPLKALPGISEIAVLGMAATPLLLLSSYNYIDSSVSTVIHFIYPVLVVVGGILLFKEKATSFGIAGLLCCTVGVMLFYDSKQSFDLAGIIPAALSGVTCAAYVMMLSRFKYKNIPIFTFSFYVSAIGGGVTLLVAAVTNRLTLPVGVGDWGLCLLFALSVTVGAVLLYQKSIFIIGGSKASVLSALEPTTSLFVGILIMGEGVSVCKLIGSALVIASGLIITFEGIIGKKQ